MVNPRQRRKARSSSHKKVTTSRHAKRNLRKMKPIRGPKALQDSWDNKKTVRQNYAALGLVVSLKQSDSGGSEIPLPMVFKHNADTVDPSIPSTSVSSKSDAKPQQFGKIIRDADGNIVEVKILEDNSEKEGFDVDMDRAGRPVAKKTAVVEALENLAETDKPVPRFSSNGETDLLKKLIAKHGHDYSAMGKDRRLNPWQRTAGQLERACKKARLL
ncbi:ribosome biogenesis protein Nop16 [Hysterangium stoloniferum]|nr:ribosome biogenesis protein Nop16 [Hysterangium stoloniferum]